MGRVLKKPTKRKEKTQRVNLRTDEEVGFQRFLQANAIRKQIKDSVGDILNEIPLFEASLSRWTSTGKEMRSSCEIVRRGKQMEWAFHSDIRMYPEVWFRDLTTSS